MQVKKAGFNLPDDWKELLGLFQRHGVHYMIVGGVAANYHGQPRFTQDIDLFLARDEVNAKAVKTALTEFGFGELDISIDDLTRSNYVIQLGRPPNRVDLLTDIKPLIFEDAWARRQEYSSEGLLLLILSCEDLIQAKKTAGRAKDLADVETLERVAKKGKR